MSKEILKYMVDDTNSGIRIDKYIADMQTDLSRSYIQKLIKDEAILVDYKPVKVGFKLLAQQEILINLPEPTELNIIAENIPLDIIYEDKDIIIINKKKGMVVHPSAGHNDGTLVNALLYHCKDQLSGINGVLRPGIVHRIDMNTTGAIVVCKNDYAHNFIAEQLKVHSITRKYNAIVHNRFTNDTGEINEPIGRHPIDRKKMAVNYKNGKDAVTNYRLIENLGTKYAHVECMLKTGRTHQIRVHLTSINHSLVGDDVYGCKKESFNLTGQSLHARVLGFIHPTTKEYVEFEAPLPDYFIKLLEQLNKK